MVLCYEPILEPTNSLWLAGESCKQSRRSEFEPHNGLNNGCCHEYNKAIGEDNAKQFGKDNASVLEWQMLPTHGTKHFGWGSQQQILA
jgi:hypothetical protein